MLQTVVWAIISAAIISSCCNLTASDRVPNTLTHYFSFCKSLSSFFASLSLLHCRAPIIIETVGDCKQPVSCCSALLNDSPPLAYVTVCACVCYMPLLLLFIFSLSFSFPIHSLRRRCRLHFRLHCVHSFDSSSLFLSLFLCFFATRLMLEKAKASKRGRENFEMGKGSHCMWMCVCVYVCVRAHAVQCGVASSDGWRDQRSVIRFSHIATGGDSASDDSLCAPSTSLCPSNPIQPSYPFVRCSPLVSCNRRCQERGSQEKSQTRTHKHKHSLTDWVSEWQTATSYCSELTVVEWTTATSASCAANCLTVVAWTIM